MLIRPLEQQGFHRLYSIQPCESSTGASSSSTTSLNIKNHKIELKKLNHSILIAYLDLLEILVKAPNTQLPLDQQQIDLNSQQQTFKTLRDQKLEDIELLFFNMHHLINELRPHQARDNIRCILEMQKRQRLDTADKFKTHLFKIVDLLKICIQSIRSSQSSAVSAADSNEVAKSNKFLDELNSLVSNATRLTKSLDRVNDSIRANTNELDADVDMLEQQEPRPNSQNSNSSKSSRLLLKQQDNCDFKDLILCDLIDDFLLKENEF